MVKVKLEKLEYILDRIMVSSKNLSGCSIITTDGFSIANRFVNKIDEDTIAEMAVSIQKASEVLSKKSLNEQNRFINIISDKGFLTVTKLSPDSMLLLLANKKASIGLISLEQKQNIRELMEII